MISWIDVKDAAAQYKTVAKQLYKETNCKNELWVFSYGSDPASEAYVKGKQKDCEEVGIPFNHIKVNSSNLPIVINLIQTLQEDSKNKIIIQAPFINSKIGKLLMDCISENADADCLSASSIGKLYSGEEKYPATAYGVKLLLNHLGYDNLDGERAVVVGRSFLAGAPCAKVLQDMGATVTIIHSKSKNYSDILKTAKIVVLAVGSIGMFNEDDFSDGAIILDVGISRGSDGKLHGDFVLNNQNTEKNLQVTPVPGGMGLMTRVGLLYNIINI